MRVIFVALIAASLVCGSVTKEPEVCTTPDCVIAASSIIQAMDFETDPCNDFYRFACGGWMDSNVIPDGESVWGRFYELDEAVENSLEIIVSSPEESESVAVTSLKTMYKGCMDTQAIEDAGLDSVLANLGSDSPSGGWPMVQDEWNAARFDHSVAMGTARNSLGLGVLLHVWVYLDGFHTETNIISVDQPTLGLPFSMYGDLDSYADYIAAYKTFMVDTARVMVRELGTSVSTEQLMMTADNIFDFEAKIAAIMTPASERRNFTAMYNPMTVAELKDRYKTINWDTYMTAVFKDTDVIIGDDEVVIVLAPDYLEKSQSLEGVEEVDVANYIYWRSVLKIAEDLTQEIRDIALNFKMVMTGVTEASPRSSTCRDKAVGASYRCQDCKSPFGSGAFGFAAASEYVKAYFDEASKSQANGMVEDLRSAFKELVGETDWMDVETQVKAMEKADQMYQLIGYPDWLLDPSKVDEYYATVPPMDEQNHLNNILGTAHWFAIQDLVTLRQQPKKGTWLMHPALVNAWYSKEQNSVTIPAAILLPPVFKGVWPRYLNYGAMGMVIGHEITHGFDDQGRQYDGTGSLVPWWSQETLNGFTANAKCFIDQYNNYTVPELIPILGEEDAHINGKSTLGENIADNGGIRESFRAYIRSVESQGPEPHLPGLQEFSPEQMFFISEAQVWCELHTVDALLNEVLNDQHSPSKFHVNGPMGNSDDFQTAFSCPADSIMNRANKCKLW